jgi:hypothetical protein
MPRYEEKARNAYHTGFQDGWRAAMMEASAQGLEYRGMPRVNVPVLRPTRGGSPSLKKRKPTAWNKFVKINSKKKIFRFANGRVNLKKLGVAWRKKKRGR